MKNNSRAHTQTSPDYPGNDHSTNPSCSAFFTNAVKQQALHLLSDILKRRAA